MSAHTRSIPSAAQNLPEFHCWVFAVVVVVAVTVSMAVSTSSVTVVSH